MTVPHGLFAQSFTAGCYTRNPDGTPGTLVGQPVNGACQDNNGSPTYPYGSNGQPGTAGSGNLQYVPLEPLSITQGAPQNFCELINMLFKVLIYVGGMLAVLYLVLGGITFMVSEVVNKRIVARQRIQGALWGLAILLTSWVVLNTLNPATISACNMLAPYQSNGIIGNGNQPTTGTPANTVPQIVLSPNTPVPGRGNSTIEDLIGRNVLTNPDGTAMTLTVNTVGGDPSQISAFRERCTASSGVNMVRSGAQTGGLSSQTVYICAQR